MHFFFNFSSGVPVMWQHCLKHTDLNCGRCGTVAVTALHSAILGLITGRVGIFNKKFLSEARRGGEYRVLFKQFFRALLLIVMVFIVLHFY